MAKQPIHSLDVLRQLLAYDPETGKIWWIERKPCHFAPTRQSPEWRAHFWNSKYASAEAFIGRNGNGYLVGRIDGQKYYAHRVIWALHNGRWPAHGIDHINGVRDDNRIVNLREATAAENSRNARRPTNNTSGVKGVSLFKATGRWEAYISAGGSKKKHLGFYATRDEAADAYAQAARQFYGDFARLA